MWLKVLIFIFLFLVVLCVILFAQDKEAVSFLSSVGKAQVRADEVVNFKITIQVQLKGGPKIELPKLEDDFEVISQGTSESITWEAGQAQQVSVLQFGLLPKREGSLTIGRAKLKVGSKEYTTEPITITVSGTPEKREAPLKPQVPQEESDQITL